MEYYRKIRNVREDKDIKQYEFANMLGVLPKTYNTYETGHRGIPIEVLNRILKILHLSLDYVLDIDFTPREHYGDIQPEIFARNIRIFRKRAGLTQRILAQRIGCNQQTLSEYEKGHLIMPLVLLKKFCQELDVSADVITGRAPEITQTYSHQ